MQKGIITKEKKVKIGDGTMCNIKFLLPTPRKGYRFVIDDYGILSTKKIRRAAKIATKRGV